MKSIFVQRGPGPGPGPDLTCAYPNLGLANHMLGEIKLWKRSETLIRVSNLGKMPTPSVRRGGNARSMEWRSSSINNHRSNQTRDRTRSADMKLTSESFDDGSRIPADFAFCDFDEESHVKLAGNRSPQFAWSDVPEGTKSFVLV